MNWNKFINCFFVTSGKKTEKATIIYTLLEKAGAKDLSYKKSFEKWFDDKDHKIKPSYFTRLVIRAN